MKTWRNEVRNLKRYLLEHDALKDGKARGDLAWGQIWQQMGRRDAFELRQKWLVKAGWDTSWVFHNWNQLPHQLKLDLVNNEPKVEEDFKT